METTRSYNDPNGFNDAVPTTDAIADYERTTLAAAFADRERAHDAIHRLQDEGFGETWLGVTKSDENAYSGTSAGTSADVTRVEADNWFTRFFGEGDESLQDALVRHGVAEFDARGAGSLPARSAILTVDGENHPELAAQIIEECGGRLLTRGFGSAGNGTSGTFATTDAGSATPAPGAFAEPLSPADNRASDAPFAASDAAGALGYGKYRAGATIDDDTRLQLREERLRIDKERRSRGEATISKTVITQAQEVDVPLIREELFIERRAVSGAAASAAGLIGSESEVVRIPLTEEKLNVSKTAVVTEEVVIGKREVQEMGHVSETTRKEELNVQDVDESVGIRQTP